MELFSIIAGGVVALWAATVYVTWVAYATVRWLRARDATRPVKTYEVDLPPPSARRR